MRWISSLSLLLLLIGSFPALAADNSATALSEEETLIRQKVRTHAYPGGIDEEPLKVQEQLPIVGRKMQPAQEPVEAEDAHTESND
jgi:hypothetical protein